MGLASAFSCAVEDAATALTVGSATSSHSAASTAVPAASQSGSSSFNCLLSLRGPSIAAPVNQIWVPPPPGFKRIHTDGSWRLINVAAGGCVIRNEDGSWFLGFSTKYSAVTALAAELYAVRDALAMADIFGVKKVELFTNAISIKVMFDSLNPIIHHPLAATINDIANSIRKLEEVEIKHIRRDLNVIAHKLAEVGNDMAIGHRTYYDVPDCVKDLYEGEKGVPAAAI